MQVLKQSTTATILVGPVLDADGAAYTSAVIGDFNITKNGNTAALAAAATATHSHNGMYLIALTTGNTDTLGRLDVSMNNTSYGMTNHRYEVLTANQFDALVTNGSVTAAAIADAVWDEATVDHTSTGSFGEKVGSLSTSSVTVAPLQATAPNRVAGTEIVTYINDTSDIGPIVVTDGDGDAVDLSSYTLKVCVERKENGTIDDNITPTISGAGNNQVTFTPTSACVNSTTPRKWSLRSTSNGQVFAFGDFKVEWPARLS